MHLISGENFPFLSTYVTKNLHSLYTAKNLVCHPCSSLICIKSTTFCGAFKFRVMLHLNYATEPTSISWRISLFFQIFIHQLNHCSSCFSSILQEMKLLAEVDQPGSLIDNYVTQLNFVLSRKAAGLVSLQARLARFQHRLKEQEILSRKRVPR